MKKSFILTLALLIFSTSYSAYAELSRDQRISDALTMISLFEHRYGPAKWKEEFLGISLDDLTATLMGKMYRQNMTDEEFYKAMSSYAGALKDTHIWFIIPSTYSASLGFKCDYVDGKTVIDSIDSRILSPEKFPFQRGDELVSIDGIPVNEVMQELEKYNASANELALKRFLSVSLTLRYQREYPDIPSGDAILEIASAKTGTIETVKLPWIHRGKPLAETPRSYVTVKDVNAEISSSVDTIGSDLKGNALEILRWSAIDNHRVAEVSLGNRKPFFTLWDTFVERTNGPLFTGVFILDGKRIGFLRIPSWMPPSQSSWIAFLEKEIKFLDKHTDALVIDQTNNPGGAICLSEVVSGFFVQDQIPANLFEIRANRHFLLYYESSLAARCSPPGDESKEDCQILQNIVNKMRTAIARGAFLTEPIAICGNDGMIHPYKNEEGDQITYLKPILMLVNEMSISAADMTPAPLQDAGRIKVLGSRTNGAGGNVETTPHIGHSDFQVSQTESLAVRPKETTTPNGVKTRYLENVGVAPDIEYEITYDDFMNGYLGYRQAVDNAIRDMVK